MKLLLKNLAKNVYPQEKKDLNRQQITKLYLKKFCPMRMMMLSKQNLQSFNLRTFLNLGDSLKSPIGNSKKLKSIYQQLIEVLNNGIKNNEGNKKSYFVQTLNDFEEKFKDYKFADGQIEIPENENLIKVLFKKQIHKIEGTAPNVIKDSTNNIQDNLKNSNKKLGIVVSIIAAVALGIIALVVKKRRIRQFNKTMLNLIIFQMFLSNFNNVKVYRLVIFTVRSTSINGEQSNKNSSQIVVDTSINEYVDYGIYAIRIENALFVKRLQYMPGKLLVKSDNPICQPFEVDLKTDSVDIIGAVVYVMYDMSCL